MSRGAGGDTPALTPLGTRAGGVGQPLLSTAQSPDLWQAGKSRPYLVIWEDLRCYASKIVFTPVFPPPYRVYFRKNGLDSAVWGGVCSVGCAGHHPNPPHPSARLPWSSGLGAAPFGCKTLFALQRPALVWGLQVVLQPKK